MEGVPGVTLFTAQPKLSTIQKKIQKMCKWTKGLPSFFPIPVNSLQFDVQRVFIPIITRFLIFKTSFVKSVK
jgi:hypothetical protein